MSEPIKAGDLAAITKVKRCGCADGLGHIFQVAAVQVSTFHGKCYVCGSRTYPPGTTVLRGSDRLGEFYAEITRCKRIPPLADLQTYRNTDENPVDPVFDSALDIMSGKVSHGA